MFGQDFTCPALLEDRPEPLPVRGCHPLWRIFPDASGSFRPAAGLVRVRSPLLTESRLMSFPPVTEMFQLAGFASRGYGFAARYRRSGGLPHSEIPGSKPARGSPGLIAACYVLHRLSVPRHPPNALLALEPRAPCTDISPRANPAISARRTALANPFRSRERRPRLDTRPLHDVKQPRRPHGAAPVSFFPNRTAVPPCGGEPAPWWRRTGSNR